MAAKASLGELAEAKAALKKIEKKHPEAYAEFVQLLKDHRMIGYKNIARLAYGSTPDELKA